MHVGKLRNIHKSLNIDNFVAHSYKKKFDFHHKFTISFNFIAHFLKLSLKTCNKNIPIKRFVVKIICSKEILCNKKLKIHEFVVKCLLRFEIKFLDLCKIISRYIQINCHQIQCLWYSLKRRLNYF